MQAFASAFSTQLAPNSTQSRANSYLQAFLLKTHLGDHFYHKIRSQEHKTQPYYLPRTPKVQEFNSNLTCRAGIQGPPLLQEQMAMNKGWGLDSFVFQELTCLKTSFPLANSSPSSPKHPIAAPNVYFQP
jgi:hypothetical protein